MPNVSPSTFLFLRATFFRLPNNFRYEATEYHPVDNGTDDYFGRPHVVVDRTRVRAPFVKKSTSLLCILPCKFAFG